MTAQRPPDASVRAIGRWALAGVSGAAVLLAGCSGPGSNRAKVVGAPACLSAAAPTKTLANVPTATVTVPGQPYSVVATPSGSWAFVSISGSVGVLSEEGFVPRLVRMIPLPAAVAPGQHGLALTAGGRYLLASAASGAVVIDAARAERGVAGAVLGRLVSHVDGAEGDAGASAVVSSRDGRYVFVARERAGGVAVFDLQAALASHFRSSGYRGPIRVGLGPVAIAISPSGRRLYVASLAAPLKAGATAGGGTLSVVDVALAERRPWLSVLGTVPAGCEPVGLVSAPDGRVVWVTTLADHAVLGFATARLVRDPARALVASIAVGEAPVGVLPFAAGRRLLVADSGHSTGSLAPGLTVVDTTQALAGHPAVVGSVPASVNPRQLALVPQRATALVTNYGSAQVEAIDLSALP